jgi:ATP/maltotriose-dependent transcriptional regulator MalT
MPTEEEPGLLWPASAAAVLLWDDDQWDALSRRQVALARRAGALSELSLALTTRAYLELFGGEIPTAAALIEDAQRTSGGSVACYGTLAIAAMRGREEEVAALAATTRDSAELRGEGIGIAVSEWASALLFNGLGRYDEALVAAENGSAHPEELGFAAWSTVELIEAAARTGQSARAAFALRRLTEITTACGSDWALGVAARSRALLSETEVAEPLYREAIARLGQTRIRVDLARAHLLYGEWLRRRNRRVDAREQLRTAYELLAVMGLEGFAARARRELLATGETVRKRSVEPAGELTEQEAQIARLARDGLSNPEISSQLFLSPRTVEWHLRKVFTKLGISSRKQLRGCQLQAGRISVPA